MVTLLIRNCPPPPPSIYLFVHGWFYHAYQQPTHHLLKLAKINKISCKSFFNKRNQKLTRQLMENTAKKHNKSDPNTIRNDGAVPGPKMKLAALQKLATFGDQFLVQK